MATADLFSNSQHANRTRIPPLPARLATPNPTRFDVSRTAGPFEIASEQQSNAGMRGALMTGLLVVYPAFATIAAIAAGLYLGGLSSV